MEKKRSTYKKGSVGDLPPHCDKTKYAYRWLSANKISQNTDYYDPRGWELDKNQDGKNTSREDRILGRMPIDMFESMKEQKEADRIAQNEFVKGSASQGDEALEYEFKKKGGRIKSDFSLTKNN